MNHSYETGEFVLQIPKMPLDDMSDPIELIRWVIHPDMWPKIKDDLQILHVGQWIMSNCHASEFFKGKVALMGDTAHTVPPSGGFGMNLGIHDAHNLAYKLALCAQGKLDLSQALETYSTERLIATQRTMKIALESYEKAIKIAKELGKNALLLGYHFFEVEMDKDHLVLLHNVVSSLPGSSNLKSSLFSLGKKVGSYHLERNAINRKYVRTKIPLFFPEEDGSINYNGTQEAMSDNFCTGRLLPHFWGEFEGERKSSREFPSQSIEGASFERDPKDGRAKIKIKSTGRESEQYFVSEKMWEAMEKSKINKINVRGDGHIQNVIKK